MTFTPSEKDRTVEVLFYLFFSKKDPELLKETSFWQAIKYICEAYNIDSFSVQKAISVLAQPSNNPTDIETWYLLNKLGCTVRPLYKMTGFYHARQKISEEHIEKFGPPMIVNKIHDTAMKAAMRTFLYAAKDFFGVLQYVDYRNLDKFFGKP